MKEHQLIRITQVMKDLVTAFGVPDIVKYSPLPYSIVNEGINGSCINKKYHDCTCFLLHTS